MSARALVAIARSWLGRTLIMTTVAKRPMITITTITSTRVKPLRRFARRGRVTAASVNRAISRRSMGSGSDEGLKLQDRKKDCEHDHRDDGAQEDDDHRLQH